MATSGAVDPGSPVSRTEKSTGTPMTQAGTPQGTNASPLTSPRVLTPLGKREEECSERAVEVVNDPTSPPVVDSGRVEGAESVPVASPPVVDSPMDSNPELPTAPKKVEYCKLNSHGEPIKEQERVSYQNMLVRYADWKTVRWQMVSYFLILLLAQTYRGHYVAFTLLTLVDTVKEGRHIHCCCNKLPWLEKTKIDKEKIELDPTINTIFWISILVLSLLSPLWERFIGRRRLLICTLIAGIPASVTLIILKDTHSPLTQLSYLHLNLCGAISVFTSVSSLIEMLPYETRFLAVYNCFFGQGVSIALGSLNIWGEFSSSTLGLFSLIGSILGAIVAIFFLKDSICHLNIRNDVDIIEKIFKEREEQLYEEKPEGGRRYHRLVAQKIFMDLVYLDQDELSFREFYKRLWRSFTMIEIVLATFQAISIGFHEYEAHRWTTERFDSPMENLITILAGFVTAGYLTHALRKAHRNRALCLLLAALLLVSTVRHAIVDYDHRNTCASIAVMHDRYEILSRILVVASYALGNAAQIMVAVFFLEKTPSVLRSACVLLVYMPTRAVVNLAWKNFTDHVTKDLDNLLPIYTYHVLIIVVTMLRTKSRLPFSLYLFDLMPHAERSRDDGYGSNEKASCFFIRPMLEQTAQPGHGSEKPEEKPDDTATDKTDKTEKTEKTERRVKKVKRGQEGEKGKEKVGTENTEKMEKTEKIGKEEKTEKDIMEKTEKRGKEEKTEDKEKKAKETPKKRKFRFNRILKSTNR